MADLKYYDIILKPLTTEKSMQYASGSDFHPRRDESKTEPKDGYMAPMKNGSVYTFYVHPKANKSQIKEAVQKLFPGTKVSHVNTLTTHPKKRHRRGGKPGGTVVRKKAMVKLSQGEITIFEGM